MQARFLLGPAGSGKTFRCLAEIRAELLRAPDGPALILLAPKQATFQLERQLLASSNPSEATHPQPLPGGELGQPHNGQFPSLEGSGVGPLPNQTQLYGYTRLRIFSFERLAQFVLETLRLVPSESLSEEGRVMVLRALLIQRASELKRFGQSARRPGFALQLSALLGELQSHGFNAAKLRDLSGRADVSAELQAKLHDLAVLCAAYTEWLSAHELQDANRLLEAATETLSGKSEIRLSALWLDGFAEMTPQEMDLLAAVVPCCGRATLAFCLDHEPQGESSWLSIWSVIGKTFSQCRERIAALPDCTVTVEAPARQPAISRFARSPELAHLESNWTAPTPFTPHVSPLTFHAPRLVACANPDAEATLAAREILKFVRSGGRFRDAAVLVRHLDGYHKPLARTFRHYGIPFFLDRREGVAHHPLAELTRSALRTVTFDWQHEDWFAALKAGFAPVDETAIDRLENEALERGWRGAKWRSPLRIEDDESRGKSFERLRQELISPFEELAKSLEAQGRRPTGAQLAEALRDFWDRLGAEATLDRWSEAGSKSAVHITVWEQMNAWLDNLALAFSREALPLRDWLLILEAGLASLTVGVIPPALDQVLIGAVDRSRNPDLKLAFVLGLNEGVFPAAPNPPLLLTDADREALGGRGLAFGPDLRDRLSREQFLGYIACTRSSERLVLTCANHDADGRRRNPSAFFGLVKKLFPALVVEEFTHADWREAEHAGELVGPIVQIQNEKLKIKNWTRLLRLPALARLNQSLHNLRQPAMDESLSPALAEKLYGPVLKTSVSRLENFAACPFRFLVHSGLRAEERKVFELDFREQGSFQHDVLKIFHEELTAAHKRWRDVSPAEARERVGRIAAGLMADYRDGLLRDSAQTQFTARMLAGALQDFIEVLAGWMRERYQFDPAEVELGFGDEGKVPAWELDLGGGRTVALRGRIDRVDLWREPGSDAAWCVVIDYKSSEKRLDPVLLEHGVQLQLLSYLNVLRHWPDPRALGLARLIPAGVFYVNLRGRDVSGGSRAELAGAMEARKEAYRHTGRFDAGVLAKLDASGADRGEQFNFRLKKDGTLYTNSTDAMPSSDFAGLLARVETQLREMGRRIFSGEAGVDPYRKGAETPCKFCDYAAVCRIDPWTHEYRVLRRQEVAGVDAGEE